MKALACVTTLCWSARVHYCSNLASARPNWKLSLSLINFCLTHCSPVLPQLPKAVDMHTHWKWCCNAYQLCAIVLGVQYSSCILTSQSRALRILSWIRQDLSVTVGGKFCLMFITLLLSLTLTLFLVYFPFIRLQSNLLWHHRRGVHNVLRT